MSCTADHNSMKGSLATFVLSTTFVAVQVFAGGNEAPEVQYMGNCPVCLSTLSVVIDLPRGTTVHGAIEPSDEPPPFGRMARHLEDMPDGEPDWNDERIK